MRKCMKWADAPYYHNHSATITEFDTHESNVAHNTICYQRHSDTHVTGVTYNTTSRRACRATQFDVAAKYNMLPFTP